MRTVYVSPELPPIALAPDPKLSNPPLDRQLSQKDVTHYWNDDRSGFKACLVQKRAAVNAVTGAPKS